MIMVRETQLHEKFQKMKKVPLDTLGQIQDSNCVKFFI